MSKAPKLRFKEFSGDWESKKLCEITKLSSGGTPSRSKTEYWEGDIPWITTGEINFNTINQSIEKITQEGLENSSAKLFPKDTILIAMYGQGVTRGKCALLGIEATTNQACAGIFPHDSYNSKFMYYYISKEYSNIRTISNEGSQKNLSLGLIGEIEIIKPKLEEQEKIASFFSLIDDKISLQGEKLELLKDYKSGMMQKIFSRELRFKDDEGRDYPEWEVTTIEKVADLEKGFTPDTKNEKNWIGDIPWLSIADMKQGKYISDVSKHISDEALGNKKLVPKGTLIMSFKLTLGRLGIINREMMTNEAICHFYWRNKSINTEYMYYYLSTVNIESFGCRAAKGITLNNDSLNSIVVKLPVIEEQNKIADILMKIDRKVEKEQEKLDSLNEYKKGLLQQMFV